MLPKSSTHKPPIKVPPISQGHERETTLEPRLGGPRLRVRFEDDDNVDLWIEMDDEED